MCSPSHIYYSVFELPHWMNHAFLFLCVCVFYFSTIQSGVESWCWWNGYIKCALLICDELEGLEVNWGHVYDQEIIIWMSVCSFAKWTEVKWRRTFLSVMFRNNELFSSLLFWIKNNGSSWVSGRAAELFLFSLYSSHSLRPFPRMFLLFTNQGPQWPPKEFAFK